MNAEKEWFRVEAHWNGGGVGLTLQFYCITDAWNATVAKYGQQPGVQIDVRRTTEPASPCGGSYVDPKITASDDAALRLQIQMAGRGW